VVLGRGSGATNHQRLQGYDAVEAARAESFEVKGDELEAQSAKGRDELAAKLEVDQAREVVERDLDAGDVSLVVSDPQDT
jgi:hypothetical protein